MSDIKSDVAELLDEMGIPFERDVHPLAVVPSTGADWGSSTGISEHEYYSENEQTTLFPPVRRADTPMIKLSLSGTIELTQEQYQSYLDGARLGPGAVVEVRAVGYVVQPGAAWVKRMGSSEPYFEREGRVKIRLVDIGELSASGEEWSE